MGAIWAAMIAGSVCFAVLGGHMEGLTAAALSGAQKGVELALSIGGTLCLWSGVMEMMRRAGLTARLARLLRPVLGRLFPQAARDDETMGLITANVSANLLGLGSAATPMGIAAVRRMQAGASAATDEVCRLIVMNTASIQLLPTTVAALRASLGAENPFDLLPAVWITSVFSVTLGLAAAALLRRRHA